MLLTPAQAAEILGVSVAAMRRYARDEVVKARKIGKYWRFLEADLYAAGKQPCSTNVPALRIGGFASASVDARLDAALAQRAATTPRNTSANCVRTHGGRRGSGSRITRGTRLENGG
ncbi:MAG: helix-turn-helix domain-containing protein [Patescibacteria group bacterium]|nr:helix-turn-helix domain-containing protein [Patescibacteria group bacterium]